MKLVTNSFPVLAILAAALGYFLPGAFTPLGNFIVPLLTLIMFAMGLTLTLDNFRGVVAQPRKIAIGTVLQFLLMPLAAYLIAHMLRLERQLVIGLVLVGCCPGGTASNVICYLARGDLALSISLTMVSTLLSVIATPFLTWLYLGQAIDVPVLDMMLNITQIVIVPVAAGILINTWAGQKIEKLTPVLPVVSVIAIVIIIGIVVALNSGNLAVLSLALIAAVILHNAFGFGSAYGLAKLLRLDERTCRTIAIEVGMQNSGLGVALASQFFSAVAALPGAIFSLWHNVAGSMLAGYFNSRQIRENEK